MKIEIYDEKRNPINTDSTRKILAPSSTFGIIRQLLVENIGIERMKDFLFHFGWEMGVHDAIEAKKESHSYEYLVKYGPILHIKNGHIKGIKHACSVKIDDQKRVQSVYGRGTWIDSYEAIEHIKWLGISNSPVCHTLIGYASGFMSTIFEEPLLAKEITCVGKGDADCTWVVRTEKEWKDELQEDIHFYNKSTPIVKELEYTYDQLLEQKNFITRLANYQNKLMEEVSNGSNLQTIADIVYDIVQKPIIIEDLDFQTVTYAGLSETKYVQLREDMMQFINKSVTTDWHETVNIPIFSKKKTIKTKLQKRLITPIQVQSKVLGYCALIYENFENDGQKNENQEEDYLFLDRFANAASLILLNEKTKYESFERMKGNFLEQILDAKYPPRDIINRGRYTGVDLGQPYYITVMQYNKTKFQFDSIKDEYLLQQQIFETTYMYFTEKKQNLLVGQREGNIVLFFPEDSVKNSSIFNIIKEFNESIIQKYPLGQFKFGISNLGSEIQNANRHYEEAMIALRMTTKKKIVSFQSLGIVGVLINSNNINGIKMVAEQELGPLYDTDDIKMLELLKTLYIFLLNGGKLEQTMTDLSLSMSGLRHRINRIESLLNINLRNPNETHQLLLILKSLIAIGELTFEN